MNVKNLSIYVLTAILFVSLSSHSATAGELDTLLRNLKSTNSTVRKKAADSLDKYVNKSNANEKIVPALLKVLNKDDDSLVRLYSARTLSKVKDKSIADSFKSIIDNPNSNAHAAVVDVFPTIDTNEKDLYLVKALSSKDIRARKKAADHLSQFSKSNPDVQTALINSLKNDDDSLVRLYAARSLKKTEGIDIVPIFISAMKGKGASQVADVVEGIQDKRLEQPLIDLLKHKDDNTRKNAVIALSDSFIKGNSKVENLLISLLKNDDDSLVQLYSFRGLTKVYSKDMISLFNESLSKKFIAREVADFLEKKGDLSSLPNLIKLLGTDSNSARVAAVAAIRKIIDRNKDATSIDQLRNCLPNLGEATYSKSTKDVALFFDIFLGGFGLFSASAEGKHSTARQLKPEEIQALLGIVTNLA
jgi:HEAT repeat protein